MRVRPKLRVLTCTLSASLIEQPARGIVFGSATRHLVERAFKFPFVSGAFQGEHEPAQLLPNQALLAGGQGLDFLHYAFGGVCHDAKIPSDCLVANPIGIPVISPIASTARGTRALPLFYSRRAHLLPGLCRRGKRRPAQAATLPKL